MTTQARTAVILAAGWGSRIQSVGEGGQAVSKPLIELDGRPLLVRVMQTLHAAGVARFVVVTGYLSDVVSRAAEETADALGVSVECVFNPKWDTLANGVSLLAAADTVNEPFLLSMSDHAYDVEIPRRLIAEGDLGMGVRLCIDRKIDQVFDLDDATKVVTDDLRIVKIGKQLDEYNAVDIGLFFCNPEIFAALKAAYEKKGDCSLSDGMQILGEAGRFGYMDVEEYLWQDVDTPETLDYAHELMRERKLRFPD